MHVLAGGIGPVLDRRVLELVSGRDRLVGPVVRVVLALPGLEVGSQVAGAVVGVAPGIPGLASAVLALTGTSDATRALPVPAAEISSAGTKSRAARLRRLKLFCPRI